MIMLQIPKNTTSYNIRFYSHLPTAWRCIRSRHFLFLSKMHADSHLLPNQTSALHLPAMWQGLFSPQSTPKPKTALPLNSPVGVNGVIALLASQSTVCTLR